MDKKRQTSRQTGNDREGVYRDRNRQTGRHVRMPHVRRQMDGQKQQEDKQVVRQ